MSKTAILVDGGFYRLVTQNVYGYHSPEDAADALMVYCHRHLREHVGDHELYRIYYYDCPPVDKQVYHPLRQKDINLKLTDTYTWVQSFLNALKRKRKVALRLGQLDVEHTVYTLKYDSVKKICSGVKDKDTLTEQDFELTIAQKGVDMKIGIDIATLAYNHLVDQIVIIGNDRDYVPALKLARTAGIDIVLDPMGQNLKDDNPLVEHIDGLRSCGNPFAGTKSK
jgi:uncharacterized protein (TIGR00288 family)